MNSYKYQVGGSLVNDAPCYVTRQADHELYQALKSGNFCYILNSRQMGKSSILVRTRYRLQQENHRCSTIDMTRIGNEHITPEQWYKGVVTDLWRGFNLLGKVNLKNWWREEENISVPQKLSYFIEDILLNQFPQDKIVVFVDEIDSIISLNFSVDDFFALIRFCYNQRAINSEYNRITFALFGVATPSDLISDKVRTPFNIGQAIDLQGFSLEEAQPLVLGLESKIENAKAVLQQILTWTGGQPFLTQKLCYLVLRASSEAVSGVLKIPPGNEAFWVESVVKSQVIHKWESQDEPEHFRTIRDRILRNDLRAGRLLGIYQQIVQGIEILADDSPEQADLLLSGLVVKQENRLWVKNPIYQEIFNLEWVENNLQSLRPYSQAFDAWIAANQADPSRLLRGQALRDAQQWAQGKSLSDLDYQFLAESTQLDRQEVQQALEAARLKEVEARLALEKKNAKRQTIFNIALSSALALASILGGAAFIESQRASLSEIKAIATSSEALLSSNQGLDALLQVLRAAKKLRNYPNANAELIQRINLNLQQATYSAQEFNRLLGHTSTVYVVAFSPDGQLIASGGRDNTVKLWKADGTLFKTLTGHQDEVSAIAFNPQGNLIASGGNDRTIRLWTNQGTPIATLTGHRERVTGLVFSPQGKTLISSSLDGTIALWELNKATGTYQQIMSWTSYYRGVWDVDISPDSQMIAAANGTYDVQLWRKNPKTGYYLKGPTLKGHTSGLWEVAFSPDGKYIASASADQTVKLWRTDGTLVRTLIGHRDRVDAVAFSPDSQLIASAGNDKTVKIWTLEGDLLTTLKGHKSAVWGVTFAPSSKPQQLVLASASWDQTVRLWKPEIPLLTQLTAHQDEARSVTFSPDDQTLASTGYDRSVKLWTHHLNCQALTSSACYTNKALKNFKFREIYNVAFSPDGQTFVTASAESNLQLWRKDGKFLQSLPGHKQTIYQVVFSPDGQMLASASWDKTIKLWKKDLKTGLFKAYKTLYGHQSSVWGIAFSPDGELIASTGNDRLIKLWTKTGLLVNTLAGHQDGIWAIAFSPQGDLLASGSWDKTIKLWTRDGKLLKTLTGHQDGVVSVAFSPDGQILASASDDHTIKLWTRGGRLIKTLTRHSREVTGVAFSHNGQFLASSSKDGSVILWDFPQVLKLDEFTYACSWLQDYLRTNPEVSQGDRQFCH